MTHAISRRRFMVAGAAAGLGILASRGLGAEMFKTKLRKAMIGKPTEDYLKQLKDAGFDGLECSEWSVTPAEAAAARKVADRIGIKIHIVGRGSVMFNSPDPAVAAKAMAEVETALRAAQGYGADAILLVPGRVSKNDVTLPDPWDFKLEYDQKTGRLVKAVAGDNEKFKAYIEAHNRAVDAATVAIRKLIPVAEETKVVIAVENVWNNLWVKPDYLKLFISSFQSPWVKAHFDIGNIVRYTPPEDAIRTLGSLIVRCHVKDFKKDPNPNPGTYGGQFVDIREGGVNWPAVRKALDDIGYSGWMTIEASKLPLAEDSKRLDLIIAGQ